MTNIKTAKITSSAIEYMTTELHFDIKEDNDGTIAFFLEDVKISTIEQLEKEILSFESGRDIQILVNPLQYHYHNSTLIG